MKQFAGVGTSACYRSHMKQPRKRLNAGTDEATVEFELSAQDLLALSHAESPAEGRIPSQAQTARLSAKRVGLSASVVVAVVVTGIVLWLFSRPEGAVRSAMASQAASPLAQSPPMPVSDEQVPVRFANPFDHTEVFEFPPGTSETSAHEAVVEVLLKRAQDRQHRRSVRSVRNQ